MSKLIMNAKPVKKGFIPTISRDGGETFTDVNIIAPTEKEALAIAKDYVEGHTDSVIAERSAKRIRRSVTPGTMTYAGTKGSVFEFGIQVAFSAIAVGLIVLFNRI